MFRMAGWAPAVSLTILLSADDFGLTEGISRSILEAHDEGVLNGVSILANGHFVDEAVAEARRRPSLRLSVHLNLVEGMALSRPGRPLRHSFLSLWRAKTVPEQVRTELAAQVSRVADAIGRAPDGLDGHRHAHMIPGVFECVVDLAEEFRIPYVRLSEGRGPWRPGGALKRVVLNHLARRNRPLLEGRNISTCDAFLGVLHGGPMTTEAVRSGLRGVAPGSTVEILFHPGGALPGDEELLRYRRFYFDPARHRELEELKSPALRSLLIV